MASIHEAIYVPLSKRTDEVSVGAMREINRLHWACRIRDKFIENHGLSGLFSDEIHDIIKTVREADVIEEPE